MSQLYELWKKLKHKLADRQFLLSLLPALLIALYLAGLLIHAAYNGVRIMFSANFSATAGSKCFPNDISAQQKKQSS